MVQLTKREREVFELFKEGKTREDICKTINITRENLRDIVRRLKKKSYDPEHRQGRSSQPKPPEIEIADSTPPETMGALIQYIKKNNSIVQEIGKRLLEAERRLGELIEKEVETQGNVETPLNQFKTWMESGKNLALGINSEQFYRARIFASLPGLVTNVIESTRNEDDVGAEGMALTRIMRNLKEHGISVLDPKDPCLRIIKAIKAGDQTSREWIRKFNVDRSWFNRFLNDLLKYEKGIYYPQPRIV